jgi:hypothetical protein
MIFDAILGEEHDAGGAASSRSARTCAALEGGRGRNHRTAASGRRFAKSQGRIACWLQGLSGAEAGSEYLGTEWRRRQADDSEESGWRRGSGNRQSSAAQRAVQCCARACGQLYPLSESSAGLGGVGGSRGSGESDRPRWRNCNGVWRGHFDHAIAHLGRRRRRRRLLGDIFRAHRAKPAKGFGSMQSQNYLGTARASVILSQVSQTSQMAAMQLAAGGQ